MANYDVLLINPPMSDSGEVHENLGLGYIAACLRKRNISVKIVNLTPDNIPTLGREITDRCCRLIGVSIPFQEKAAEVFGFIAGLRGQGVTAHISIGGIFPTFAAGELLQMFPAVDSVVIGEGEETFGELAERLLGGQDWRDIRGLAMRDGPKIHKTETRLSVKDLDSLPFPARDLLPAAMASVQYATMAASRGCYGRCSFCSVVPFFSAIGPKYRRRSSQNVLEEIEILYYQYGVRNIAFNDAIFIGGRGDFPRVEAIAEGILQRRMDLRFYLHCRPNDVEPRLFDLLKRAGLKRVFLGIESGSQAMLDRFGKDTTVAENIEALQTLSKLGIFVSMGFITFDDRITFEELSENLVFVQQVKKMFPGRLLGFDALNRMLPLAGTGVEKRMKEAASYQGDCLNFDYRFDDPKIDMIYRGARACADVLWRLKRALKLTADHEKEWLK